jgi:hypothetical protein
MYLPLIFCFIMLLVLLGVHFLFYYAHCHICCFSYLVHYFVIFDHHERKCEKEKAEKMLRGQNL